MLASVKPISTIKTALTSFAVMYDEYYSSITVFPIWESFVKIVVNYHHHHQQQVDVVVVAVAAAAAVVAVVVL